MRGPPQGILHDKEGRGEQCEERGEELVSLGVRLDAPPAGSEARCSTCRISGGEKYEAGESMLGRWGHVRCVRAC